MNNQWIKNFNKVRMLNTKLDKAKQKNKKMCVLGNPTLPYFPFET